MATTAALKTDDAPGIDETDFGTWVFPDASTQRDAEWMRAPFARR
jgi:hypothetical protein